MISPQLSPSSDHDLIYDNINNKSQAQKVNVAKYVLAQPTQIYQYVKGRMLYVEKVQLYSILPTS